MGTPPIFLTFFSFDFLTQALKKNATNSAVLKVYWMGQHAVHEIGMHSLYEWMTLMTGHPTDAKQWKEWAKRDSDARAYC